MPKFSPIPPDLNLGNTLARRVFALREFRNLTRRDLARHTRMTENRIEDIEGGIETWLSFAERQLLAKALSVEPHLLQDVETRPDLGATVMYSEEIDLGQKILSGQTTLPCPKCGALLNCRVEQARDFEGNVINMAKAFCAKCHFVLR